MVGAGFNGWMTRLDVPFIELCTDKEKLYSGCLKMGGGMFDAYTAIFCSA